MIQARVAIGIDIGGTFTDFALLDRASGALYIGKRLTTPDDPARALLAGVDELCTRAGIAHRDLERVSHATTLVTNAIIERKGCKTGLLTTEGFRDVLAMGRESRYDHYDFRFDRPEPVVPGSLTGEVAERTTWNGEVRAALDVESARERHRGVVLPATLRLLRRPGRHDALGGDRGAAPEKICSSDDRSYLEKSGCWSITSKITGTAAKLVMCSRSITCSMRCARAASSASAPFARASNSARGGF